MKYRNITIHKHKTCNTWYARYRANGKQFYVSAITQKDCYNKLKKALNKKAKEKSQQTREPVEQKSKTTGYTLNEWFDIWFKTYKQGKVQDTTVLDYMASMRYIEKLKKRKLKELTNIDIMQTVNAVPYERRRQKVYELLSALFKKAEQNRLIDFNPITDDKPKHTRVNGIALSEQDEKIIESLKDEKYKIWVFAMFQGLRKGEVLALKKKNFDLKNKILVVESSLNIFNKLDKTKNKTSNRVMPLFDKSIKLIQPLLEQKEDEERIFEISNQTAGKLFKQMIKDLNLNEKYTPHSLRHTFITKCQEAGVPLHIIQKWVGHTIGSKVTNSVYTHTRELAELENIEKMNT